MTQAKKKNKLWPKILIGSVSVLTIVSLVIIVVLSIPFPYSFVTVFSSNNSYETAYSLGVKYYLEENKESLKKRKHDISFSNVLNPNDVNNKVDGVVGVFDESFQASLIDSNENLPIISSYNTPFNAILSAYSSYFNLSPPLESEGSIIGQLLNDEPIERPLIIYDSDVGYEQITSSAIENLHSQIEYKLYKIEADTSDASLIYNYVKALSFDSIVLIVSPAMFSSFLYTLIDNSFTPPIYTISSNDRFQFIPPNIANLKCPVHVVNHISSRYEDKESVRASLESSSFFTTLTVKEIYLINYYFPFFYDGYTAMSVVDRATQTTEKLSRNELTMALSAMISDASFNSEFSLLY